MQINRAQSLGIIGANQKSNRSLSKILQKLATAKRINSASDDAAGLSISEELRTQIRGFQSANRNVDYAQAAQYIAEGTGNETTSILQRQRELAVQASNGTLTDDDRAALDQEYQALNEELTRISDAAQFNTQNVANGQGLAAGNGQVLAGPNPGSELDIEGADFTADNLNVENTSISTAANASNAIDAIDSALQNTAAQRTNLGANINRMDYAKNMNSNAMVNTQNAESRIRDLDYAKGIMEQTRQSILNQSSMATLKNFNQISKNNMMFLLGQ